ncbi:glycosyltransferase [Nakamurella deserti]|uniref:glycosyltransferase n=1 Tax=Nakamurella deserti TaxID=2164074 RepID=UPI000DBE85C5|nr:glycosyltransferase [Nakamurella deserti]
MTPRRVVYAGFATRRHSGGVHVLTQHVRLLRAAGHEAWLWLPDPDDRTDWIDADVPVLAGATTPIGADDLLVLPETPTVPGRDPAPGARTVIFNQNHFYTFAAGAPGPDFPGWAAPPGVWAVTGESRDVLSAVLPGLAVSLVPNPVDGELFAPRPGDRARVSWFPRKRPREASLLRELLRHDPRLAGVDLVEMVDIPRADVADVLATTTVFVALGHSESFGLPVAEALASGCLVVGYDGGGGHELFEAPGAWRIPDQRPLLLRDRIAELIAHADGSAPLRAANRRWVLDRYPLSRTAGALDAAVTAAFARPGSAAVATHPAAWIDVLGPHFTAYA